MVRGLEMRMGGWGGGERGRWGDGKMGGFGRWGVLEDGWF